MATLNKIRGKAGLLVIVIGVALLAFIIGDLLHSGQTYFRMSANNIVTVDGEKISYEDFLKRVDELTEFVKMQSGQSSVSSEMTLQINQGALEELISGIVYTEEAKKVGLEVSEEEMSDLLQGENVSPIIRQLFTNPQTGIFDKTQLNNFLQTFIAEGAATRMGVEEAQLAKYKAFWLYVEKMVKQQRLIEKFNTLLAKSVVPNKLDAQAAYDGGKENVDFVYSMQSYASIPDSTVTITDGELKSLYDKRKEAFKQTEIRSVKYITVDIAPNESDFKGVEEKINALKEDFAKTNDVESLIRLNSDAQYADAFVAERSLNGELKNFVASAQVNDVYGPFLDGDNYTMYRFMGKTSAPDSIKARLFILPPTETAKADSLLAVLNAGADFAEISAKYSADQRLAANGGDLGWFTEMGALQGVGPEFKNLSFSAPLNGYFKVTTEQFIGIAQVTDRTANVPKAKVAELTMAVNPSSKTRNELYNKVNQYLAKNQDIESFKKNAGDNGFNLLSGDRVTSNDNTLGVVKDARQLVRWAFNNDKGSVSEINEADGKFVVMAIDDVFESGYASMAQVKDYLTQEIMADKKATKIIEGLKAKNLSTLEAYADAMSATVDTAKFVTFDTRRIDRIGDEPKLSGLAPYVAMNKVEGPIQGKNGVYVFSVYAKNESEKPFDAAVEKAQLEEQYSNMLMYQTMGFLRNKAKIEDHRARFF